MTKNTTYAIKMGFIIALMGTLLMLLLLALGLVGPASVMNDQLMIGGTILFISLYIFLLIGIFLSIKKDKEMSNGEITFLQALKNGVIVSLSTAIFSVLFTVIFYELMYPEYNADMVSVLTEKLSGQGLSENEISEKIDEQTKYYSTALQSQFAFTGNLITGFAFSLLLSLFLRSKNNNA